MSAGAWRVEPYLGQTDANVYDGDLYVAHFANVTDARACVEAMNARRWRDIAGAPKVDPDCPSRGPLIWLGGPGFALQGWWGGKHEPKWIVDREGCDVVEPPSKPTHYMPLPAPPQVQP